MHQSFLLRFLVVAISFLCCVSSSVAQDQDTYTDPNTFKQVMLTVHNNFRAQHSAQAVTWDDKLASFALGHCRTCVFQHSGGPYGENLSAGYPSAAKAIEAWGNERTSYSFGGGGFSKQTGHFTQMVWKETKQIGCGAFMCKDMLAQGFDSWYVTCEYFPRGNVVGGYTSNVLPPKPGVMLSKAPKKARRRGLSDTNSSEAMARSLDIDVSEE